MAATNRLTASYEGGFGRFGRALGRPLQRHRRSLCAVASICHGRAPSSRERRRRRCSTSSDRRRPTRRGAGDRASAGSRPGSSIASAICGDGGARGLAGARRPPGCGRPRSAAAAGRRRRHAQRRAGPSWCEAALDRRPPAVELAAARATGEVAQGGERRACVVGRRRGDGDERGVGNEPAGRDVDLAGVARRGPARARGRRRGCAGRAGSARRRAGATARPRGGLASRSSGGLELLRRRSRVLPGSTSISRHARRAGRRAARRRARRTRARSRGAAASTSRPRSAPCARWMPSSSSTTAPRPTRGEAEQAGAELGVEDRAGRARPRAGRRGPGSRRAGSTPRRRWRRASSARSPIAGGSKRKVPAPRRKTWIR